MELDEMNLGFTQVPYFDGMRAQAMDDMVTRIRASSGVIFACTAQLFAPSAMLQTFLEFLECGDYRDVLFEKHCLLAMVSKSGGERSALEYLARTICYLGGFESGRIGLQEIHARNIQDEADAPAGSVREIIERESEDFYRAIRQNRRYIMPMDGVPATAPAILAPAPLPVPVYADANPIVQPFQPPILPPVQQQPLQQSPLPQQPVYQEAPPAPAAFAHTPAPPPAPPTNDVASKLNLEAFTERQEQDIKELTALFSQKYVQPSESQYAGPSLSQYQPVPQQHQSPLPQAGFQLPPSGYHQATPPQPKVKTVKQITQSLPHYYQPQMAAGMTAVIQLSITGAEAFDGYLTIVDSECDYTDGIAENPEITIIADSGTWSDVLKGKHTAQKAFMIGGLKVRGNFVLLTKFDTLFKM